MAKFEVGDRVRLRNEQWPNGDVLGSGELPLNKDLLVEAITSDGWVRIKGYPNPNKRYQGGWSDGRFELAPPAKKRKWKNTDGASNFLTPQAQWALSALGLEVRVQVRKKEKS